MHDDGLSLVKSRQKRSQASRWCCSTSGQHLVAVGAHWIDHVAHYTQSLIVAMEFTNRFLSVYTIYVTEAVHLVRALKSRSVKWVKTNLDWSA